MLRKTADARPFDGYVFCRAGTYSADRDEPENSKEKPGRFQKRKSILSFMLNDVVNVHSKGFKPVGQRQPDGFTSGLSVTSGSWLAKRR